jgi:hypothetical protein
VRYVQAVRTWLQQLEKKENNPLAGLQAAVAIMREMLHAIFGMFRTQTAFDVKKVFPSAC